MDSIERIKADAIKRPYEYWDCKYVRYCDYCPSKIDGKTPNEHYATRGCFNAMPLDLIERTIKVMENSIEQTCKLVDDVLKKFC